MELTKHQFLERFTQDEVSAILAESKVNSDIAAWVFWFENMDDTAPSINIESERTILGVREFEAGGLLAEGRADQILSIDHDTQSFTKTITLETGQRLFSDNSLWVVNGGIYKEDDLVSVTNAEGDEVAYFAIFVATGEFK